MNKLPISSEELIRELDQEYPLRNPQIYDTSAILQRQAGARDVVEHLLSLLEHAEGEGKLLK